MAKQRKDKLYCDAMAEQNGRMIHVIGKVVNAVELYKAVADDYVAQAIAQGVPSSQVKDAVTRQMGRSAIHNLFVGYKR